MKAGTTESSKMETIFTVKRGFNARNTTTICYGLFETAR